MNTRRDGSQWGVRTIRNGTVRFAGKVYRVAPITPTELPYDGRLDGKRALFYTYGNYASLTDSIFLHSFGDEWPGPNCINGYFVWHRWREYEA